MKIGIIGYGSMGKMLLWKFAEQDFISKQNLYAFNRTIEKLDETKEIAQIVSSKELASFCDFIFICVCPADIQIVLEEIKESLKEGALVISLNGNISFEKIRATLDCKTAKVIPSLTAEIGRSQTLCPLWKCLAAPSNSWSSEKSWGQFVCVSRRRTHFPVNTVKQTLGKHSWNASISQTTDFPRLTEFLINNSAI